MTDENKNTDAKATTKAETTAKAAPKAKAKPKVKTKPKAVAKSTAKPVEDAPYLKKDSKTEPSHTQSAKRKSSTSVVLLLIVAALILTTTYKFNEERNNLPAQANTHDNSVVAEPTAADLKQVVPDNNNIKTSPLQAPEPQTLLTDAQTDGQTDGQTEQQVTNNDDLMQQRRQAYEKEIQLKQQQFKALMEARQKERAEVIAKQKAELQRIKQKQLETRVEARAIQQQILDLHEKLRQLMKEAHTQN